MHSVSDVARPTGVAHRGLRLRDSEQYLSCTLVLGRGIVFCHYYYQL